MKGQIKAIGKRFGRRSLFQILAISSCISSEFTLHVLLLPTVTISEDLPLYPTLTRHYLFFFFVFFSHLRTFPY